MGGKVSATEHKQILRAERTPKASGLSTYLKLRGGKKGDVST